MPFNETFNTVKLSVIRLSQATNGFMLTRVSFPKCVTLSLDFDQNWKKIFRFFLFCFFKFIYYMCVCTFLPSKKKPPKIVRKKNKMSKLISRSSVSQTTGRDDRTSRLIQLKYRKIKSTLLKSRMLSIKSPLFLNSNWKFGCWETFRSPQLNNWYQLILDVTAL